jgi:hypothetical protein
LPSVNQGPNPDEINVYIEFIPFGGDTAKLKITQITTLPPDTLEPEENYTNQTFTDGMVLTFRRKTEKGGRIKIKTDNDRYACGNGDDLQFLPVVHEPPPKPVLAVAEGISNVRWNPTCNCFQGRTQVLLPTPSDTGFQGLGGTYQGRACLKVDSGSLSDIRFQSERNNRHIGVQCGSDAKAGIATDKQACWTFDISINKEDGECNYHWIITGEKSQ